MRSVRNLVTVGAVGVSTTMILAGCNWQGLNSLPLPGAEGRGDGSWTVTIEMPNVTTLTMNSPVRVADVNVGSISGIRAQDYTAIVDVSLNREVTLPANAHAKIGQTSLLGSQHLELMPPPEGDPHGRLAEGDRIPIDRASLYPTTEQTLSSLSVVLTNGGLQQFEQIADELNQALDGRQVEANQLIGELRTAVEGLDAQRDDIISAMEGLDQLSRNVNEESDTLARALSEMPEALELINSQKQELQTSLTSLGDFGYKAKQVIDSGGSDLVANIENLVPVLEELASSGQNLTRVLNILITFPFPQGALDNFLVGDFANLYIDTDLSWDRMQETFFLGTELGNRMVGLEGYIGFAPNFSGSADPYSLDVPSRDDDSGESPEEGPPGEGPPGEGSPGDGQPEEGQTGDAPPGEGPPDQQAAGDGGTDASEGGAP